MFSLLDSFPAIAWDFDGTLYGHPKSPLMHKFILDHPEKRHVILTFRTHGMQNTMFKELRRTYPEPPGPKNFSDVHNISNRAWAEFDHCERLRELGRLEGPLTKWEEYYVEWKGMMCHDLHLPVLVDDKPSNVLPGCRKYNITFIDPNDL